MENQAPFYREKKYWTEKLTNENSFSNFPFDFLNNNSDKKEFFSFDLSDKISQGILSICNNSDVKLHVFMISGIILLLNKYTNNEDIIITTPIYKQKEDLDYINKFLVLRTIINNENTFKDLILKVRDEIKTSVEHQDYPVEELLHRINQSNTQKILYDIIVMVENIHDRKYIEQYNSNILISFKIINNQINCSVEYNSDKYRSSTITQIFTHFKFLLNRISNNLNIVLKDVELISLEERNQLLFGFNDTLAEYPKDKTIYQLFEDQVEKTPDKIALVFGNEQISYAELNLKSNQLASVLKDKGVKPDEIIGILVDRSFEMIIGILGILKAGGAYLPIDPDYPEDRIKYMLNDSKANFILTKNKFQEKVESNIIAIYLDSEDVKLGKCNNLGIISKPSDRAYIIYTSGTTGTPKGAMIDHKNVVRLFFNDKFQFDFGTNDVWTLFHSYCFDFSVWEMYGAILFGGKLVIVPKIVTKDPSEYRRLLIDEKVTVLNQTPSSFYNLIDEDFASEGNKLELKYVIFGGEALKPIKLKDWRKKYKDTKLINMYGITETTVHVTYKEITELEIENNESNIGKPIPTLTIYILDKNLKLLPIGVTGEICVGGEGVCKGYLFREELTSERFITNPYKQDEIIYRSGDLGKLTRNGDIEYIGRIDYQVKIRGFRIELGEIENQLLGINEITEAVVIDRTDNNDEKYLCAYYVKNHHKDKLESEIKDISSIKKMLLEKLPDYMIPSYFVELDKLPLTGNGKIDRKSLPVPKVDLTEDYIAPRNTTERELVEIWSEVLGVDKENISINANYFSIGGDSMKAIRLLSRINKILKGGLKIPDLYHNQTVSQLAERINDTKTNKREGLELKRIREEIELLKAKILKDINFIDVDNIDDIYPMSDIEKGMIYSSLMHPESAIYHDQFTYQLRYAHFNFERFKKALSLIVDKHHILRTSFNMDDYEESIQIVFKNIELNVEHEDLSQFDKKSQEKRITKFLKTDRSNPFNFSLAPLWRMRIFLIDSENIVLAWSFHHSILDGWSNASFITELNNTYLKLGSNNDYTLECLKSTYKDYIIEHLSLKKDETIREFWRNKLSEYKRIVFPIISNNLRKDITLKKISKSFSDKKLKQLENVANNNNTSLKHLCFAAYSYMLSMLSYDNDIVVGLVSNNRPLTEDGDKIIGCFLNTVPVRIKIPQGISWREYINLIDQILIELKDNDKLSLLEIKNIIDEKSSDKNPFFDTIFNYIDFHIYSEAQVESVISNTENVKKNHDFLNEYENTNTLFDFTISRTLGIFSYVLSYSNTIISDEEASKLVKYFIKILNNFIETPEKIIIKDEIILDEEKQQLLYEFNNTQRDYPRDKTIHELFEEQVEQTPNSIALVYNDQLITYRELNSRSNQLGKLLREEGFKTEKIAGILLDRSIDMLVGILAILKAGGAYLPIDPLYPESRIKYISENSNLQLILCSESYISKIDLAFQIIILEEVIFIKDELLNLDIPIKTTDLSYVIYTSGSTGTPKGVGVEHLSVLNLLYFLQDRYPISSNDSYLLKTSYCFDVSISELFGWIHGGGRLCILGKDLEKEPVKIIETINKLFITHINFVPSVFNSFSDSISESEKNKLISLKHILIAGETLLSEHLEKFKSLNFEIQIVNLYGPTEATVFTSYYNLGLGETRSVSIGKPISNNEIFILDKNLNILPIGVFGELLIGGMGLARNYLNNPELTSEKFISHPFKEGERLYHTGDLARWLPDGNIEFLGRIDHQVKIRGFRIELGEIENVLLRHEKVKECIVIAREENSDKYLCAYVVKEEELSLEEIRGYLSAHLPYYMIPSYFVQLEKLPITSNGKVDRKALPAPEVKTGDNYVAPSNEIEEKLVSIWSDVLNIAKEEISVTANFFVIGGHSLRAINLISKIHKEFKVKITLMEVFDHNVLEELAKLIKNVNVVGYSEIKSIEKREYYHTSSAQKRMYVLNKMKEQDISDNVNFLLKVKNDFDVDRFEIAINKLVYRHEALRTSFIELQNKIYQKINTNLKLDIKNYSYKSQEEEISIVNSFIRPFDLLNSTEVFRIGLLHNKCENYKLIIFDMHHIIADGVTGDVLKNDFNVLMGGEVLNPLRIQYKDYAAWQNRNKNKEDMKTKQEYWLDRFSGKLPILDWKTDYVRPNIQSFKGETIAFNLGYELTSKIRQILKDSDSSLYMFLLSIYNILLSKYSGQEDIVVGTPSAGRRDYELKNIVGYFVNTIAMRNYPRKTQTFKEFLKEVKINSINAFENEDYQFDDLIKKLDIKSDLSRSILFDTMFVVQNAAEEKYKLRDDVVVESGHVVRMGNMVSQFDIITHVMESQDDIKFLMKYCTDLFKRETIDLFKDNFISIIHTILEKPNVKLEDISISHGFTKSDRVIVKEESGDFCF